MAGTSPTVRQRELGTRLRVLRVDRGMTVEEVAEKLLCSATKISRLETGARRPSLRDVRDLCQLYDIDESTSADLMALARQAREQGWWAQYEDLKLDPYIGLEQEAISITSYTMFYFPALLQTEEYAGVIIKAMTVAAFTFCTCSAVSDPCAASNCWCRKTGRDTAYCWMKQCYIIALAILPSWWGSSRRPSS